MFHSLTPSDVYDHYASNLEKYRNAPASFEARQVQWSLHYSLLIAWILGVEAQSMVDWPDRAAARNAMARDRYKPSVRYPIRVFIDDLIHRMLITDF